MVALALLVVWLVLDTRHRPEQLISFGGVCMFVVVIYLLSAHRAAVSFAMSHTMALLTAGATTVSKQYPRVLSRDLSPIVFAETLDIIWPCAPICLRISKSASLR